MKGSPPSTTNALPRRHERRLNAREKLLYAPMSNLGDLTYDADAVRPIPDSALRFTGAARRRRARARRGRRRRRGGRREEEEDDDEGDDEAAAEDEGVRMVKALQRVGTMRQRADAVVGAPALCGRRHVVGADGVEEEGDDDDDDDEDDDDDDDDEEEEEEEDEATMQQRRRGRRRACGAGGL